MNDKMTREILDRLDRLEAQAVKRVYGTASDDNTVAIDGTSTAVELPAITPVVSGDRAAVLVSPGDAMILGPIDSEWQSFAPTFTGSSVSFSTTGWYYRRVAGGTWISGRNTLSSGITGTLTLDISAAPLSLTAAAYAYGAGFLYDDSGADRYGMTVEMAGATLRWIYDQNLAQPSYLDATNPVAAASGDLLGLTIFIPT